MSFEELLGKSHYDLLGKSYSFLKIDKLYRFEETILQCIVFKSINQRRLKLHFEKIDQSIRTYAILNFSKNLSFRSKSLNKDFTFFL